MTAGGRILLACVYRLKYALLELRGKALNVAQAMLCGGNAKRRQRVDPDLLIEQACPLRTDPGDPHDLDEALWEALHEPACRWDRSRPQQVNDLCFDRCPNVRQLSGAALQRERGDRRRARPDARGGVAVGAHPVGIRLIERIEAAKLFDGVGDLSIGQIDAEASLMLVVRLVVQVLKVVCCHLL
jgi:hypothetical protein